MFRRFSEPQHLQSPDDPSGGAPNPPTTPGEQQGDAAPPALTREDVATMLTEQRDNLFSMQRKMVGDLKKEMSTLLTPPAPPEPKPEPKPAPHDPELLARMERYESDLAFSTAVQGLNLRGNKRDRFRQMFSADKPDDPSGWAKEQAKEWGIGTEETTKMPQEPSRPGAGAPAAQRNGVTPTRVNEWTQEDYEADFLAKAADPSDKYSIVNKAYYKALHKRALVDFADVRYDLVGRK